MNTNDTKYKDFALVREMLQTPEIIASFDFGQVERMAASVRKSGRLFLTGEGSSRIFPAKRFMSSMQKRGSDLYLATEGSRQALEADLSKWTVIGASNSGQTKELISLIQQLKGQGHTGLFGVTSTPGSRLTEIADSIVLSCGKEDAVAATKSVVEQALVYQAVEAALSGCRHIDQKEEAGNRAAEVLQEEYDARLIADAAAAPVVYLAGRNNGVAEELALKTNEITRKRSQFVEGTLIVHGIEEVMNPEDVVVLIEPFEEEMEFYKKVLLDGVGATVIVISNKRPADSAFATITIPALKCYDEYFQLLAGWNLLVQIGVACGIDIDKPKRARKVGNAV